MTISGAISGVITSLILCIGVVPLVTRKLFSSVSQSQNTRTINFAGRTVSYGLSVVWIGWATALGLFALLGSQYTTNFLFFPPLFTVALVLFSTLIGFIDDVYGDKSSQGFRGHIKALLRGSITTGAMKLLFISAGSFVFAWFAFSGLIGRAEGANIGLHLAYALIAGATIALCCNFVNLTDLRPGRASKASLVLIVIALLTFGLSTFNSSMASSSKEIAILNFLIIGINGLWLLAPLFAAMPLDLREAGMLGDAGANGLGVLVGIALVMACKLNFFALGILLAALLFLNVLSEKLSFSKIIESNKVLKTIDMLGRRKD